VNLNRGGAAWEMRVWPLEVALRREASNHRVLRRLDAVRGERHGKGVRKSASGRDWEGERELFAVEVSKSIRWRRNWGAAVIPGQAWRISAYWPGGARHVGDASPVCGFHAERGRARPDTVSAGVQGREGARQAAETVRR
jgi:hypothetical protein